MGNGNEKAYEVIFMGPAADTGWERERVIHGLQDRFNLSRERAERLVQKAPIVVKRGLTEEVRDRYVEALHSIGAIVRVREYSHPGDRERAGDMEREGGPTPYRSPGEGEYCPWEDMEGLGFFQAFLTTLREVLFSPSQFYRRMPTSKGITHPLIFGLILGVLGGVFSLAWQRFFYLRLGQFPEIATIYFLIVIIGLPFIVLITLYLGSAIIHLCLMVVGGNRRGFEATFRVIAYSSSTQIFALIPFVGSMIIPLYALVIEIIGLRESHGIGTGRAILAIFLPVIVIVALLLVVGISLFYKLSEFL